MSPGNRIQDFVNANPAGATFVLQPGVYRMQSVIPKDGDSFIGQPGAVLNGSQLLTSFSQQTSNGFTYWVTPGPSHPGQIHGNCETTHPLCGYREEFFIDNQPLLRVADLANVTTGTCYFDYHNARIYFLDDPNVHTVEVSVTTIAFEQNADNVTIQGLIIEKYANPAQAGVIGSQAAGSGWIIQNNEVRLNHGAGIKVGNAAQLISNYVHDNGQLGISVGPSTIAVLVTNNEIARNNRAGFSVNWEAGGAKFGNAHNVTVTGNYVHDNVGNGLWADGSCSSGLYESNVIVNNAAHGILHEISHAWTMRNNVIIGNGFGTQEGGGLLGVGINVVVSDNVEAYSNFVANNYRAISLVMAKRTDCSINRVPYTCDLNNNYIHGNTVVQSSGVAIGLFQSVNDDVYYTSKNNRFVNDAYCMGTSPAGGQAYRWLDAGRSKAQWVGFGQDVTGTWSCPGVFISSPNSGDKVSGTVRLCAFAADTVAVSKLQLSVDGNPVTASTTTTYNYLRTSTQAAIGVTYSWDTMQVNTGTHTLTATAYNAGGHSSSTSINLTVTNR